MKKPFLILASVVFYLLLLLSVSKIYAQEAGSTNVGIKQELRSDRQQIKEQHQEMKQDAQAARTEEKQLWQQIDNAVATGDMATANRLKEQMRAVHKENIQEKQQDMKDMRDARRELKDDVREKRLKEIDTNKDGKVDQAEREAWQKRIADTNKDGKVDEAERKAFGERRMGRDNNNPPGPQGGPGVGPDRQGKKEIQGERREIRRDIREIQGDRREIRQDRKEIREDLRDGDKKGLKQDIRELKNDQRELRGDQRGLHRDHRDLQRGKEERRGDSPPQIQGVKPKGDRSGSAQGGGPHSGGPSGGDSGSQQKR